MLAINLLKIPHKNKGRSGKSIILVFITTKLFPYLKKYLMTFRRRIRQMLSSLRNYTLSELNSTPILINTNNMKRKFIVNTKESERTLAFRTSLVTMQI
jgi:hypothetical protein